jgi:peptide/nickel transport system substrate-binding protein
MNSTDNPATAPRGVSRRTFLHRAASAGLLVGAGAGLAACGRQASPSSAAASKPRRGGRLRIGMVGAGNQESLNPSAAAYTLINLAMATAVYDSLITVTAGLRLAPGLAASWTPNQSMTEWTFDLRPGVTWHDGKPFTAKDVIYSLRWMASPGNGLAQLVANVDLPGIRKVGASKVVVPLKTPDLLFPHTIADGYIVQDGEKDFVHPMGTGPFIFQSLIQGQHSVFRRNPHYWDHGKPYVDELIIYSLADDTARLNALLSGQTDVMAQMPFAQAKTSLSSGFHLLRSPGLTAYAFYMAVDKPPFTDVRVRQALRLLADRQQLIDVALDGFGTVANDLYGKGLEFYDSGLPQHHRDVAQARSLLRQAGYGSGLTLRLQTSDIAPGTVAAATLFQQQAAAGGVTINVSQVNPSAYFNPTELYLKMPFAQTFWAGFDTLENLYQYALLPGAAGNESHWDSKDTTGLIRAASSARSPAAAGRAWAAVQQQQWSDGGYIWWANADNLDAASDRVAGITPGPYLNLGLPTSLTNAYFVS